MLAGDTYTFLNRSYRMGESVDWTAPSLSPPDQLWRMNLHYQEYLEEVDDARFVDLVSDWIAHNPAGRPGAWRDSHNAYALSLRVVVWMQQLARRQLAGPARAPIIASLTEQLLFLEENLETDLGGNHLIKNIKALAWASAFFAGAASARWRAKALSLLQAAIEEQILADGVHYERSPSYHAQVFADLMECRHALGAPLPALDDALKAMAQAAADLAQPDGAVAQFNDAGLTMAYAPSECLSAFETMFKQTIAPAASFAYPAAGYFGRREGDDCFIADCGRIGPDSLPAHAHGDVLSFELSVAGQRIIVDPGVYEYIDGPRRRASRSAASHNTLCFDGLDQAEFFGSFRCARRPNVMVRELVCEPDQLVLEGTHDGFGRAEHIRRFEQTTGSLKILDRIAAAPSAAHARMLLHPDVEVELDGDRAELRRGPAHLRLSANVEIKCEKAVWWPDMGHERATKRLVLTAPPGGSEIVTEIVWSKPGPMRGAT